MWNEIELLDAGFDGDADDAVWAEAGEQLRRDLEALLAEVGQG